MTPIRKSAINVNPVECSCPPRPAQYMNSICYCINSIYYLRLKAFRTLTEDNRLRIFLWVVS